MSDETPWTKGPWEVSAQSPYEIRTSIEGKPLCRLGFHYPTPEWLANARLIAAAPAMAELLEVIADAANDTLEDDGPNGFAEETQKRARALLTQIKGIETK